MRQNRPMARWVCPRCDREFGGVNQAHVCAPGITVDELLGKSTPDWVGEIYAVVIEHLQAMGPVHEDAVDVGIFLKSDQGRSQSTGPWSGRCSSGCSCPTSAKIRGLAGHCRPASTGSCT